MKMSRNIVIGDIGIMLGKRSEFIYKALSPIDSQAMRKQMFIAVAEKYPELVMKLKARSFFRYRDIIRKPALQHKRMTYD